MSEENGILKTLSKKEVLLMPPLSLAFVGDAVYEVYVRNRITVNLASKNVNNLHKYAIKYVKAECQARAARKIFDSLTEEERDAFRRGRNAHPHSVPKNADITDYRLATGLETLVGYLHYLGEDKRLEEVIGMIFEIIESEDG